jgi:hypothetical protein
MSEIALPPESPHDFNKQSAAIMHKISSPASPANKNANKQQAKKEVNRSVYMAQEGSARPISTSEHE